MEVSAIRYSSGAGLQGRSPLLKLQSDERLVALVRRGNIGAFENLVARYESRLLAFCRHLLGCREDAEDVLQEVMAAAYNAMLADNRPINVRPWLYRIARNRCLNHLRKATAVGVDSMDIHFSDHGATTADKVHEREEFRELMGDIQKLPETQRTALVLREMDALSYEQIAEAMDTTVSSVKSLLVRARVSLAEAAEARTLNCEDVRDELGQVAEGLVPRVTPPVRRHMKTCTRCKDFQGQLKSNNKALAALFPVGLIAAARQLIVAHLGHSSASAGTSATASTAASTTATAGTSATAAGAATGTAAGGSVGGFITAGAGALATKAAAGVAMATLVTAGAVAVTSHHSSPTPQAHLAQVAPATPPVNPAVVKDVRSAHGTGGPGVHNALLAGHARHHRHQLRHHKVVPPVARTTATATTPATTTPVTTTPATTTPSTTTPAGTTTAGTTTPTESAVTSSGTTTTKVNGGTDTQTNLPKAVMPSKGSKGFGMISPGTSQTSTTQLLSTSGGS